MFRALAPPLAGRGPVLRARPVGVPGVVEVAVGPGQGEAEARAGVGVVQHLDLLGDLGAGCVAGAVLGRHDVDVDRHDATLGGRVGAAGAGLQQPLRALLDAALLGSRDVAVVLLLTAPRRGGQIGTGPEAVAGAVRGDRDPGGVVGRRGGQGAQGEGGQGQGGCGREAQTGGQAHEEAFRRAALVGGGAAAAVAGGCLGQHRHHRPRSPGRGCLAVVHCTNLQPGLTSRS